MKTSLTRRLLGRMLVLLLLTAAGCSSPPQSTRSDVPVAVDEAVTSSQALTALKLSQMCAESGTKLLATLNRGAAMTYAQPQTHYNRLLNRCLLSQEGFSSQSRFQLNTKTIYDAIEGNKLADYSGGLTCLGFFGPAEA